MEKDRDQLTPAEPEDREKVQELRGADAAGTGPDDEAGEQSAPDSDGATETKGS